MVDPNCIICCNPEWTWLDILRATYGDDYITTGKLCDMHESQFTKQLGDKIKEKITEIGKVFDEEGL